ncbi:MAG TPA: outer membrane lipoprotein carrier protein LolA [Acetobacteraceae bacterium]|nr:outer membrane lipoprotein carrier protein LolA [Acetobacteraceae bacterium]
MQRRILLGAVGALVLPLPAALGQSGVDRAALARVEAYLNGLTTLRARFLQVAQNGATAEGTAWISRPGRMRFDYDPPEPVLLVASAGQVLMYDRELKQPTTMPVSSTPLGLLLRERIALSGDITVSAMGRQGGFLSVTLHRTGAPAEGRLTLMFSENPMELRQWSVVDAQGRETRVTLYQPETGIRIDNRLFDFNDPRFLESEANRR